MKKVNSLKFWHGLLYMLMMVSFTACVDDNEDTEAPYLEVNPTTLTFENGGVQTFEISTNRQWKASVEDVDWVSLSKTEGEGSAEIQVSIPEGTIGETKINIIMSNRSGMLKSATVNVKTGAVIESKLIYNETFGNADVSQKPYISDYQGWKKSGDGANEVVYAGSNTSIRSSGLANTGAYEGASGPNIVFFGNSPAIFDVKKIALAEGQNNLKLTFGASRSKQNEDKTHENTFTPETFKVSVSSNGTTWQEIAYEKNNGDAEHPYWIMATANFTLKKATSELYIRFSASESSLFRLDDITLTTGYGGQEVDLEAAATTPETGSGTSINKIINLQKNGQTKLTEDMEFEAIVCGDPKVNNASGGTLNIMTQDATVQNEGIVLFNSSLNNQIQEKFALGDKVKVSLKADKVELGSYNGITQVTKWDINDVTVISKGNTVTPIHTTTDKLAEYAGMPATISNVTISEAGVWKATTYNFGDVTVFMHKNAADLIGQPYKAGKGSITGIVTVFKDKAQLMPRNMEDLKDFASNEATITSVDPKAVTFTDQGGNQDINVTLANAEGKSLTVSGLSGILSATVNGTTITVTASPNTTGAAIKQTLTIKIEGTEKSVEVPIIVSGPTSGNQETITIDFTLDNSYPADFPSSSAQKKQQREYFTIDNVEIAIMGESSGYYKMKSDDSSYLLIGKGGAYIEFPNIKDKKLTQVKVISRNGASTNVEVGITDTNNSIITGGEIQKWNNTTDFTYIYNLFDTTINTNYRLYVNNSYNTQLTKLELLYE